MKVGDLIKERKYPEVGLIVEIKLATSNHCGYRDHFGYRVIPLGKHSPDQWDGGWFSQEYIESMCEVVSESR